MANPQRRRDVFEAAMRVDDNFFSIETEHDALSMAMVVKASLERKVVDQIAQETIAYMARRAFMSPALFESFLEFLGRDPETQDRFAAFIAGKRITGE